MLSHDRNELLAKYLDVAVKEGLYSSKQYLQFYLDFVFQDIPSFVGKAMLDVGGGSGLFSFYVACKGARQVICLEPELEGSRKGVSDKFRKVLASLSLKNVSFHPTRLQDYFTDESFDIILLHNSINHLDEDACTKLQHDKESRRRYGEIFQKLRQLAKVGATLLITDCSRYNFFALLGIKNVFAPSIGWKTHQSPRFWSSMLSKYGFVNAKIRWTPFKGRNIGKPFANQLASYFLQSHFLLVMEKV